MLSGKHLTETFDSGRNNGTGSEHFLECLEPVSFFVANTLLFVRR